MSVVTHRRDSGLQPTFAGTPQTDSQGCLIWRNSLEAPQSINDGHHPSPRQSITVAKTPFSIAKLVCTPALVPQSSSYTLALNVPDLAGLNANLLPVFLPIIVSMEPSATRTASTEQFRSESSFWLSPRRSLCPNSASSFRRRKDGPSPHSS